MVGTQNWLDPSGLFQKYGSDQATPKTGGEYKTYGELREIELTLTLSNLTQSEIIQDDTVFFPAGVIIQEVEVFATTAAATGVAIDVGLTRTDRTTEIDFDGIIAALATATMSAGNKVVISKGVTGAGALITNATPIANVGQISASATTATAFTAGIVKIRIRYFRP